MCTISRIESNSYKEIAKKEDPLATAVGVISSGITTFGAVVLAKKLSGNRVQTHAPGLTVIAVMMLWFAFSHQIPNSPFQLINNFLKKISRL